MNDMRIPLRESKVLKAAAASLLRRLAKGQRREMVVTITTNTETVMDILTKLAASSGFDPGDSITTREVDDDSPF